ncbi:mediator of RNA polymerase II transcription subunit 29 isoform X2 [Takifugu flavidus]|uniref:mediator of RNA polymerase II transcription subunit 29 isoform X2 n=1 Tax=Takifugu flavidus TaxID=433684 RepID=UPI0025448F99|nr:mediator of RNA polymerase II transcription subunit 29 isoform X2 [Takifugu flavidus]
MASQQQQPQPGGPMAQPGLQQSSTLQQLSQQQDFDPVHRFKMLIPQLKESLQNVMRIASLNLAQNTSIDNGKAATFLCNDLTKAWRSFMPFAIKWSCVCGWHMSASLRALTAPNTLPTSSRQPPSRTRSRRSPCLTDSTSA